MKKIIRQIAQTDRSISPLVLRITLAIVLWPHGAQLLLGLFGGGGFNASMDYLTAQGIPYIIAFLVIFLQFFGSLCILGGLYTRVFAIGILVMFIGMIAVAHWPVYELDRGFERRRLRISFACDWYRLIHYPFRIRTMEPG